jgi:hypothetical protein
LGQVQGKKFMPKSEPKNGKYKFQKFQIKFENWRLKKKQ